MVKIILIHVWPSDLGLFIGPLGSSWSVTPIKSFAIDNYSGGLVHTSTHKHIEHTIYIIIFSKSEEEHLEHLRIIFQRLKAAGLKLKRSKCDFMKKHIQYLGHLISEEGIQPIPEKLESIKTMPAPRNAKEIKQFLGLAGY